MPDTTTPVVLMMSDLTPGERLALARRRRDVSQRDLAAQLGIPRRVIQVREADSRSTTAPVPDSLEAFVDRALGVNDFRLPTHEACFIMRRRRGENETTVSLHIGCSRQWVSEMERGVQNPAKLAAYLNVAIA